MENKQLEQMAHVAGQLLETRNSLSREEWKTQYEKVFARDGLIKLLSFYKEKNNRLLEQAIIENNFIFTIFSSYIYLHPVPWGDEEKEKQLSDLKKELEECRARLAGK